MAISQSTVDILLAQFTKLPKGRTPCLNFNCPPHLMIPGTDNVDTNVVYHDCTRCPFQSPDTYTKFKKDLNTIVKTIQVLDL